MPKKYSKEFKSEAVRLVLEEEMSHAQVGAELGVSDTSIGRWVAQARVDAGKGPEGVLTSDEKAEARPRQLEGRPVVNRGATGHVLPPLVVQPHPGQAEVV